MANFQHLLRSLDFIIDNGHMEILIMKHRYYSFSQLPSDSMNFKVKTLVIQYFVYFEIHSLKGYSVSMPFQPGGDPNYVGLLKILSLHSYNFLLSKT